MPGDLRIRPRRFTPRILLAVGAIASAVSLAACGSSTSTGAEADAKPVKGGTITVATPYEPSCLVGSVWSDGTVNRQLFDSLVVMEEGGKVGPWLATSWKVSPDGRTYVFNLKPGVKFTDGSELTAEVAVENFKAWINPKAVNGIGVPFFGPFVESVEESGPLAFTVTLSKPYSQLLVNLSQHFYGMQSAASLRSSDEKQCTDPVGTGPFKLAEWKHGQSLSMVRNPDYSSPPANAQHDGPAYVDKLVFVFTPNDTQRWGALTSGQANVVLSVPSADWATAESQYSALTVAAPGKPNGVNLVTTKPPFDDQKVREAFAYSLDRAAAVQSGYLGSAEYQPNGALGSTTPDYNESLASTWPLDQEKANELLDQAGWTKKNGDGYREKDGEELTVSLAYIPTLILTNDGLTVAQVLQQQAKEVGFKVTLESVPLAAWTARVIAKPDNYNGSFTGATYASPDIMNIYGPVDGGYNVTGFETPRLVQALEQAGTSADPAQAKELYEEAQKIIVDSATVLGLFSQTMSVASSPDVHGVTIEPAEAEPVFADAYVSK